MCVLRFEARREKVRFLVQENRKKESKEAKREATDMYKGTVMVWSILVDPNNN